MDPLQWRIERVPSDSSVTCWGRFDGKRCNAKIAKYRRSIATPTFLGFKRHSKLKESSQVQVWFCPTRLDRCVLGPGAKSIINYLDIPDKWHVRCGTSLTQAKVTSLELRGFVLEDGVELVVPPVGPISDVSLSHDPATIEGTPGKLSRDAFGFAPDISLQFVPGHNRVDGVPDLIPMNLALDGDKRPTMRDGKPFKFISQPSKEHLKKMEENRSISCTIMKYMKVPVPGYGVVITICTPGSLNRKELYEVSISDYPFCSCLDFKFMKVRANRKQKWMPCKHLYFVLQQHFSCTEGNVFIHCPRWTLNEVKLLLGRATWLK